MSSTEHPTVEMMMIKLLFFENNNVCCLGITSRLDHFVDAGVGAIWMSPIFVSPMVDFGYDISDFYNIQPSMEPWRTLKSWWRKLMNLVRTISDSNMVNYLVKSL